MTIEEILYSPELKRCVDEFCAANGIQDRNSETSANMVDCFILGYLEAMKVAGICEIPFKNLKK